MTGRMAALTACYAGLGVITAEIINSAGLIEAHVPPAGMAAAAAAVCWLDELATRASARRSNPPSTLFARMLSASRTVKLIVGLAFIIATPFLWFGVILKMAQATH